MDQAEEEKDIESEKSQGAGLSVSVIVVTAARSRELKECLESVLRSGTELGEVLVVLNGATDTVCGVAQAFSKRDSRVKIISINETTASLARNIACERAKGEIFYFIDDDVIVPENIVQNISRFFEGHLEVAVAGGPTLTPPDDPPFAALAGEVLSSRWGTGPTWRRYRRGGDGSATEEDLILCNLALRRSVLDSGLRFPSAFGGEENVLLEEARRRGYAFRYLSDIWVYHRRRASIGAHLEQMYRYGRGRAIAMISQKKVQSALFLIPVLFLGYLLALPFVAWGHVWTLVPVITYAAMTLLVSSQIAVRRGRKALVVFLPALFFVTHIAYALGIVVQVAVSCLNLGDHRTQCSNRHE